MSVAPDILLNMKPAEVSPPPRAAQRSSSEPGAFSKVYAKEKSGQEQAVKKPESSRPEKPTASNASKDTMPSQATGKAEQSTEPTSSETETSASTTGMTPTPVVGSVALLAQLPDDLQLEPELAEELQAILSADEVDPAALAAFMQKLSPQQQNALLPLVQQFAEQSVDVLQLPGLRLTDDSQTLKDALKQQVQAQVQGNSPQQAVAQSVQPSTALASLMDLSPEQDMPLDKLNFAQTLGDMGEAQAEVVPEVKADVLSSRISSLNALLAGQAQVNNRGALPQVPGAAVAIQQAGASEALVNKVMWLSSQNLKSAELHLDPAELGKLEIRINLDGKDQAQVTFTSPNASVREALEGQVHRLREMLASQGMNLVDVNVSGHSQREQSAQGQGQGGRGERNDGLLASGSDDSSLGAVAAASSARVTQGLGLVDYYA